MPPIAGQAERPADLGKIRRLMTLWSIPCQIHGFYVNPLTRECFVHVGATISRDVSNPPPLLGNKGGFLLVDLSAAGENFADLGGPNDEIYYRETSF